MSVARGAQPGVRAPGCAPQLWHLSSNAVLITRSYVLFLSIMTFAHYSKETVSRSIAKWPTRSKRLRFAFQIPVVLFALLTISHAQGLPRNLEEQLKDLLPSASAAERASLLENRELSQSISSSEELRFLPEQRMLRIAKEDLTSLRANTGVEILFLEDFDARVIAPTDILSTLLSISRMKGLEYYSVSRGKMHTLFNESFLIVEPDELSPIADPVFESLPRTLELYAFQEDSTFGANVLQLNVDTRESEYLITTKNITSYKLGILRVIRREALRLNIMLSIGDGYILYYGSFGARVLKLPFIQPRVLDSFYNRLRALHSWFMDRLSKIDSN